MNRMYGLQVLIAVLLVVVSCTLPASANPDIKKIDDLLKDTVGGTGDEDLEKGIATLQEYLKTRNGSLKVRLFGSESRDFVEQILLAASELQKGNCAFFAYSWDYDPELLKSGPTRNLVKAIRTKQDQICESQFIDGEKAEYMKLKKSDRDAVRRLANATLETVKTEIPHIMEKAGDDGLLVYTSHNNIMRKLGMGTNVNRQFLHNLINIWEEVMQEDRCELFGSEVDLFKTQIARPCKVYFSKMKDVYYNYFRQINLDVPYAAYPFHKSRPTKSLAGSVNDDLYYRLLGYQVCRYLDENRKGLKAAIIRHLKDECLQRAYPKAKF